MSLTHEGSLRSAISRAYYSVCHLALARAEANTYRALPGEGTHAQLWRVFSESPEPDCQRLAAIGVRLKEKRVRAGYENYFVRIAEDVPFLLADALYITPTREAHASDFSAVFRLVLRNRLSRSPLFSKIDTIHTITYSHSQIHLLIPSRTLSPE